MIQSMLLIPAFLLVSVGISSSVSAGLRIGASSGTINPDPGVFLAGYDYNRQCSGVHDDLFARAIVLDDGKTPVALVILDSIGVQYDTVQEIRKLASQKTKGLALPAERIVVCSTHTHCSPDVIGIYGPDDKTTGRNPAYLQKMIEVASDQVTKAADRLRPARMVFAEFEGGDWAVNDSEPSVLLRTATALQCLDDKDAPIATLMHFACHPTVLDGDTTLASSDWVGTFYKEMAKAMPGEPFFLQGSVGGWMQPETPERTFALAEKYGLDMAQRTLTALKTAQPVEGSEIHFSNKVFEMPNENTLFKIMAAMKLVSRPMADTVQTEVAWFSVGNAQFATHPGETAPAFTMATEKLMKTGPKFVMGLGLDELGYILRPEFFDKTLAIPHSSYLTEMSPGPSAGKSMMDALGSIIP